MQQVHIAADSDANIPWEELCTCRAGVVVAEQPVPCIPYAAAATVKVEIHFGLHHLSITVPCTISSTDAKPEASVLVGSLQL